MPQGLAAQAVYGDGSDQNTKHSYAGTIKTSKRTGDTVRGVKKKKKVVRHTKTCI